MILPGTEAFAQDSAPATPTLRSPWAGRNALPGWWRLRAWQQDAALARLHQATLAAGAALHALDDAALDAESAGAREALRAAVARGDAAHRAPAWARAAAAAAELAWRSLGCRPSGPQLHAALAMVQGRMVEAGACSGKTLSVALAAVLGVWAGRRCHLVCANEPLAARHAASLSDFYRRCQVRWALLSSQTPAAAVRAAYQTDVLLVTARRLLADRVREPALWHAVADDGGRWALVDDADRVLIDEAALPFVASEPGHNPMLLEAVALASEMAHAFCDGEHYVDRQGRLRLTAAGLDLAQALEHRLPAFWRAPRRRDELLMQALVVRERMVRGRHYDLQPGPDGLPRVVLCGDTSLSTLVPERSLHIGLIQALEAREGLPLSHPPAVTARLCHQAFFGGYRLLGGVASTLQGLENELWRIYGGVVLRLPRPSPALRVRHRLAATDAEARAMAADAAAQAARAGGAVLLCLRRMDSFRPMVEALRARGISPRVLGAAPPGADDGVLQAGEVALVPDPLLPGLDVRMRPGTTPLHLLLPEALDAQRTEDLFWARGQRTASVRTALRIGSPDGASRRVARLVRLLQARLPARLAHPLALALLRASLADRRRAADRLARLQRRQLFLHEQQLLLQLSFAARGEASLSS